MTSAITKVAGANAEANAVAFDLGITGATGICIPNLSLAKMKRNLIGSRTPFTLVGSPTPNAGYGALSAGLNYIDTGLPDTAAITLLVVAKTPETGIGAPLRPSFLGNQNGGQVSLDDPARNSTGIQLYALSDTQITWAACRTTGPGTGSTAVTSQNHTITVANVTSYAFYCCRADDTRQNIHDLTRSVSNTNTVAASRPRLRSSGTLRVGSAGSGSSNTGAAHVAYSAILPRWISDDEMATAYAQVKKNLLAKSITI